MYINNKGCPPSPSPSGLLDYSDSLSPILTLDWVFLDLDWTGLDLGLRNLAWACQ